MTTVFLSYARGDDEPFVRRLYEDLTAYGFKVWFDRENMPSRNLTFHQEIRDAVAAHERLLLVVGPKAVASEYVRQEWQFAWFEAEKVVTPILRLGGYPLAIDELKLVHAEDFRNDKEYPEHLKKLVRTLTDPPPPMGKLIAVPSLPAHYLSRTDRLIPLRDAVRSGLDSPAPFGGMATRKQFHGIAGAVKHVGMHGMGGIGKSVLANLLAHDRKIREAFPDGIVWVGLGSVPVVADLMRRVHLDFGGDGAFVTEREGKAKLKELLSDKAVLLVLDDAWRRQDLEAFDILGPRCRALITTRDAGLLTSVRTQHLVELLTDDEAIRLLALAVGKELDELPAEARMVTKQCGRLPLAVSLAGGMVAAGMSWTNLLTAFDRHKLEFFKDEHRPEQHQSLWKMIEMSVRALDAAEQMRLVELGVFPEDEAVPEKAVATLWQHTGQLDDLDTSKLIVKLKQRSLVQLSAGEQGGGEVGRVSLHDLVHDYCLRRAQVEFGKPASLHDLLLAAYRQQSPGDWWTGPNDGYFHSHLRDHLVAAGRGSELADLLHELPWLEAKNAAGLVFDLLLDFKKATDALPKTDDRHRILRLLDEALRRDIHFIARHTLDYPQALFQCLWNTCWWYDSPDARWHYVAPAGGWPETRPPWERTRIKVSTLLESWARQKSQVTLGFCWLRSLHPPFEPPGGPTAAILVGHEACVKAVAVSPDGKVVASGSWKVYYHQYNKIILWSATTGEKLQECVWLHPDRPSQFGPECVNTDSEYATYGDCSRMTSVHCLAFHPDGSRLVSGSWDHHIRLWSTATGQLLTCLHGHGHTVTSVTFSPDGARMASGSVDSTVRVWDSTSFAQVACLREKWGAIWCVAFSPDGRSVAFGTDDAMVRVWNPAESEVTLSLRGHTDEVHSVAYSPDGRWLASASNDATIRVWDCTAGREFLCLRGHTGAVRSVAFSADGQSLISGGEDCAVRIWDVHRGRELPALHGHEAEVTCVTASRVGHLLASASLDGSVRLWDAERESARMVSVHEQGAEVKSLHYTWEGDRAVARTVKGTLSEWDPVDGRLIGKSEGHADIVLAVSFSPDSQHVVTASRDGTTRLWRTSDGGHVGQLGHHPGGVNCVAYSSKGLCIASGGNDRVVRIWDAVTQKLKFSLEGHLTEVSTVAFSPDDSHIVTASQHDNCYRVWDATDGRELMWCFRHEDGVNCLAYSPNGQYLASGSEDNTVRVWDATTFAEVFCFRDHRRPVYVIQFSPDGSLLASGSEDKTIRIRSLTGSAPGSVTCIPHHKPICSLAFSPDGQRIIWGSNDDLIYFWDLGSMVPLFGDLTTPFARHAMARTLWSVAYSPDGSLVASAGGETVELRDARSDLTLRWVLGGVVGVWGERPNKTVFVSSGSNSAETIVKSQDRAELLGVFPMPSQHLVTHMNHLTIANAAHERVYLLRLERGWERQGSS